jgi:hypothetical protein
MPGTNRLRGAVMKELRQQLTFATRAADRSDLVTPS